MAADKTLVPCVKMGVEAEAHAGLRIEVRGLGVVTVYESNVSEVRTLISSGRKTVFPSARAVNQRDAPRLRI